MKIRNKRSAVDLDVGEQRIRRRQYANNLYSQQQQPGRHRRQHSGNSNNDYSFQQNFWDDVDIDTRDFFNPQAAVPQAPQQQQGEHFFQITNFQKFKYGSLRITLFLVTLHWEMILDKEKIKKWSRVPTLG